MELTNKEKHRLAQQKYQQGDAYKKYRQSDAYKKSQKKSQQKYRQSDAYKKYQQGDAYKKYRQSDAYKKSQKKYQQSDAYKKYQQKYRQSDAYKKYQQSDAYKERHRKSLRAIYLKQKTNCEKELKKYRIPPIALEGKLVMINEILANLDIIDRYVATLDKDIQKHTKEVMINQLLKKEGLLVSKRKPLPPLSSSSLKAGVSSGAD